MPTISYFYGITILMRLRDTEHNPPHIHATTQGHFASFSIKTGEIMAGAFPAKAEKLVKAFIEKYQNELMEMWKTCEYHKLPPLK